MGWCFSYRGAASKHAIRPRDELIWAASYHASWMPVAARELVNHTPLGEAEKWARTTAQGSRWPRKLAWILANVALGAAAVLVAVAIASNDPDLRRLMSAPLDDEPYSPEDRADAESASRAIERGEGVDLEDFARDRPEE